MRDDEILALREEARKKAQAASGQGPGGEAGYSRVTVILSEGKFSLLLPEDLAPAPEDLVAVKYPMGRRPEWVYANEDSGVSVTLRYEDRPLTAESLDEAIGDARKFLRRAQSAATVGAIRVEEWGSGTAAWFDLTVPGLDEPVYNIIAMTPFQKRALTLSLSCPAAGAGDWASVVSRASRSIKPVW
jgi:hypothetical protein